MIVIIDYGMGNLGSIKNMIKKIGYQSEITSDLAVISNAEKIILPGVGAFDRAMSNLESLQMIDLIKKKAAAETPILGICLGMQLLAYRSEEGVLPGLGLIPGSVLNFKIPQEYKVPHMGWNLVEYTVECPIYAGFDDFEETRFYFVHSYYYVCDNPADASGRTSYGINFTSSVCRNNIYGVQFHPEKSHRFGMLLLRNFIEKT